LITFSEFKKKI